HFAKAMRLSPLDPLMFSMQTGTAAAHFSAGRNDEAASWAERAWREKPSWLQTLRIAAASHALAGRLDRAQEVLIPLRELDPEIRISNIRDVARFARPEDLARFEEGLRKVGVRE
ncbi:MAG TPA: CadC-family transcriptional regulator, partial [Xanthobacteraceae bacterium]|nr:CadC-family transcriptional regulator [Xanthobacteraceae bacterium]